MTLGSQGFCCAVSLSSSPRLGGTYHAEVKYDERRTSMAKTVRDIMTPEVTTLGRNESLQFVKDIMTLGRVRHFPVVDEGKVVGIVSQRDLYKASLGSVMKYGEKAQRSFLEGIAVKEVMCEPVITIAPHASAKEAARLMMEKKIGCLPVLEGHTLVGIVTETDMLKLVVEME
jgi:CBS domain-containing protein